MMDIEGPELRALRGMEKTLERASSHLKMFVECNPTALRAAGSTVQGLIDRLEELKFVVTVIDEKNRCLSHPVAAHIEPVLYVNLLCVRSTEDFSMLT